MLALLPFLAFNYLFLDSFTSFLHHELSVIYDSNDYDVDGSGEEHYHSCEKDEPGLVQEDER